MPPWRRVQLEDYAFRYGRCYDSYLVVEPRFEYFWGRDDCGFVAFERIGRHIFTVGGLIALEGAAAILLADLRAFAMLNRLTLTIFNVNAGSLAVFAEHDFQLTKFGEDAVVTLAGETWEGAPFQWLRRQENFCRRGGLHAVEVVPKMIDPDAWARLSLELKDVSLAHLRMRGHERELSTFEGHFDPATIGRRRLFVAKRRGTGTVVAFLLLTPMENGELWAIETYRHRPDALRGAVPFLMMAALRQMRDEGQRQASLCLAPAVNIEVPSVGDSALLRWLLIAWQRLGASFFNARGLYHFKSRFRPQFTPSYVAVFPRIHLGWIYAFLRVTGVVPSPARSSFGKSSKDYGASRCPISFE